jgi:hypothetical protein
MINFMLPSQLKVTIKKKKNPVMGPSNVKLGETKACES